MPEENLERIAALAALGLGADASPRDIVSAYRRLARSSHPDTAPDHLGGPSFADIAAAYRFLTADTGASPFAADPADNPFAGIAVGSDEDWPSWHLSSPWPEDPPLTAGPVIIRPLPPESR